MGRLFGTDGVRGVANVDLTPELGLSLATAAARVLAHGHRPVVVVGRDTRASGELLEAAVVAGLAGAGADVVRAGMLPTPGVAYLTDTLNADFGVMLSASHNPMPDNGLKFFARDGQKLPDEIEDEIEAHLREPFDRPVGADVGRVRDLPDAWRRYADHLLETLPYSLDGIRVVVDCANGAASDVAPFVLRKAGADVVAINAEPDGLNINDGCGSTHPEQVAAAVSMHGADAGIAHDGDADRCIAVDAHGSVVDGDHILAICAVSLQDRGALVDDAVVTTVMTNLGFRLAMESRGIRVVETPVGDRYVLEALRREGLVLGGEQSGHIVFLEHATTGDGVLTALQLLGCMAAAGSSLADLAAVMQRLPQVLLNVEVADKSKLDDSREVRDAVATAEQELGSTGRVLVRPSGTEPVVRVMVEAASSEQAEAVAARLADAVASALR